MGSVGARPSWPSTSAGRFKRLARVLAAGRVAMEAGGSAEGVLWALWDASGLARRWDADKSRVGGSTGAAADRDLDAVVDLFDCRGEVHGSAARRVDRGTSTNT